MRNLGLSIIGHMREFRVKRQNAQTAPVIAFLVNKRWYELMSLYLKFEILQANPGNVEEFNERVTEEHV